MSEWKTVRLGDVCEILDSKRVPITAHERKNGSYPYYGANGIQDYVADYIFDDELVLLAEDGGNFGSKEKPIAYRVSGKCWVNNHAHVLKPKECLDVDYLCDSIKFYDVSTIVNGATRQKLTQSAMVEMKIFLPPLETQKQIAAQLDKCTSIITKHKQMLEKYDTLIKSRFIEMFGDPKINSSNLPTKKFIEVVKLQRGFDLPVQERNQDGLFNVYGSNGPLDKHDSFKVKAPGIVTGRSGTLGNVYYVLEDYWPLNTTLFSVDIHNNNVVYLKYLLELYDLSRFSEGAGVPTLNRNIVHDKDIIDVPLSLQNNFATFVQQIDKSKFAVQKSLEKAETLYKSLMQLYFA